ncbi:hypothetical protein JCM12107_06500 [Corynebacterium simulans]
MQPSFLPIGYAIRVTVPVTVPSYCDKASSITVHVERQQVGQRSCPNKYRVKELLYAIAQLPFDRARLT